MNETLLSVKDLKKSYGTHEVLKGISYDIGHGQIVGLLGPNGCGKTSMLKTIVGLINDYEGEILINGEHPGVESKKIIAFLPEKSFLEAWMTAKDSVEYMKDFYDNFNAEKAYGMLESFDIPKNQKIKTMSKGMQEKVRLALVMSREAQLYVLDEPLGGVDPVSRDFIMATILKNHQVGSSILISTHLIYDIENILDSVLMVKNGKLAVNTTTKNISEHGTTVEALFKEVFAYAGQAD